MVGDKRGAIGVPSGTSTRQSNIERHLSIARAALANIRSHNAAAHLNHLETRQLIGKIDTVLDAGASRTATEPRSEQQAATGVIKPASEILNRGAVAPVRKPRSEQPAATNLVEQLRDLSQNGAVAAAEAARGKHKDVARDTRSISEKLIFSNSDLLGEEYEDAGAGQSAKRAGYAEQESSEQQPQDSDSPQRTGEAEL